MKKGKIIYIPSLSQKYIVSMSSDREFKFTCSATGSKESGGSLKRSEASQNISGSMSLESKASKAATRSSILA